MLPARFRQRIHRVANDRKSGALELAIKVIDAFNEITSSGSKPSKNQLSVAVKFLSKSQPTMIPILTAAEICSKIIMTEADPYDKLQRLRSFIVSSRAKVAVNSLSCLPPSSTCMTISKSSTVLTALKLAASSKKLSRVYVMESRPHLEGRSTARDLTSEGVECILVTDALGPSLADEIDAAVIGADAILKDGAVVNKSGTYPLALACKEAEKPLYVLAESVKLDERFDSAIWPGSELREEKELLPTPPKGLRAMNKYFDLTPPSYVTAIVHEAGVSKKDWVQDLRAALGRILENEA